MPSNAQVGLFVFFLAIIPIFVVLFLTRGKKSVLDKLKNKQTLKVKLLDRKAVSHDSYLFKYALPEKDDVLGIKVGQHIKIHHQDEVRAYTPTSMVTQKGSVDLLIKIYRPNVHPKFPQGGFVTPWLESLKIGDSIDISGPYGKFDYLGYGQAKYLNIITEKVEKKQFKTICMIGGGTGLTPLYQVIQSVLSNKEDKTQLVLLFANKSESDMLLRFELEDKRKRSFQQLQLYYTLDVAPTENWKQYVGFVTKEMIEKSFPKPNKNTLFLYCGPPPMNYVTKILKELGYIDIFMF